jgi:hypothetical protein
MKNLTNIRSAIGILVKNLTNIRIAIGILGAIFTLIGFFTWRFELKPPLFPWIIYIVLGGALFAGLVWGRLIGRFLMLFSCLPGGYCLLLLIFDKSMTWLDIKDFLFVSIASVIIGAILWVIGSQSVAEHHAYLERLSSRPIVCAACSQYLGSGGSFQSPCPRCGSNRYTYE